MGLPLFNSPILYQAIAHFLAKIAILFSHDLMLARLSLALIVLSMIGFRCTYFHRIRYLIVLAGGLLYFNNAFSTFLDSLRYSKVYETDTGYYHLVVADDRIDRRERLLFIDSTRHSSMYLDNTSETSFEYPYYFHLGFLLNDRIKNVLFIGGGGLSAPKKFLKEYPGIGIDVVEIDPVVADVAFKYFDAPKDKRLIVHIGDGRRFIEAPGRLFDLIVLDAYTGTYVPFHLLTLEFFRAAKKRLSPGGIIAANLITPLRGELSNLFKSECRTLRQLFRELYVFPVGSPGYSGNVILLAADTKMTYAQLQDAVSGYSGGVDMKKLLSHFYSQKIDISSAQVLTDGTLPAGDFLNPLSGEHFDGGGEKAQA